MSPGPRGPRGAPATARVRWKAVAHAIGNFRAPVPLSTFHFVVVLYQDGR